MIRKYLRLCLAGLLLTVLPGSPAYADTFSSLTENLRFSPDVSYRNIYKRGGDQDTMLFAGFDLHKVFTTEKGDAGTLLVQLYATKLDDFESHAGFFSDGDDTELVYRNVYYQLPILPEGQLNVRLGHFEVPFGLEQMVDTNGTLLDYMHGRNLGVKGDWGVSVNGELGTYSYDVAWQRGSGNEWETLGDPRIYAARVGRALNDQLELGVSVFDGEIFRYANPQEPLPRSRVGFDMRYFYRQFLFMGEIAVGDDDGDDVTNLLLEVDWQSMYTTWTTYMQLRRFELKRPAGKETAASAALGVRWQPDNHWSLSAEAGYDFEVFAPAAESANFRSQLRYRF